MQRAEANLDKWSQRTGISAARLQRLQSILDIARIRFNAFKELFPKLITTEEKQAKATKEVTAKLRDQIFALKEGTQAFEIMSTIRELGIAQNSAEAQTIIALIKLRDKETEAQRKAADEKTKLDREERIAAEQRADALLRLKEQITNIGADGAVAFGSLQNEINKLTMGTLDSQLYDIQTQQQAVTEKANAMALALFQAGTITYDEYKAQLREILALEDQIIEKRQGAASELHQQQQQFSTGWQQAYTQFSETVADQGAYAKKIFSTITDGFTDSIMTFVETGKLSFKDLFRSLMAEIIKMQVNKFFLSIFGAGGPLGSMFAGFFAEGGRIPSGKFGIAGEAGPEIVRGPANVTSTRDTAAMMGGGGITQVTYNINAVDSRSFKDLVASDPAFIYNVTRAGARRIPR